MASQIASRRSICQPKCKDINGNDIVAPDLKKHGTTISMEKYTERRRIRKRRSSTSLEVEIPSCKIEFSAEFASKRGESLSANEKPCSAGVLDSPVTAIGNFIANVVIARRRSRSCSSSSSTSSSSQSEAEEEVIRPIHVCEEEATKMYRAVVQHQTTTERWSVANLYPGEPIVVSYDDGDYEMFAWDLGSGNFVFGFRGSSGTYYVQAPSGDSGYLTLTTGGDPTNITSPSNDQRCFYHSYSNSIGNYVLSPAHNTSSYVSVTNGYAVTSKSNPASWKVV